MLFCNLLSFPFQAEKTQKPDSQKSSWDKAVSFMRSSCLAPGFCSLINARISLVVFAILLCWSCLLELYIWMFVCALYNFLLYINVHCSSNHLDYPEKKSYTPDFPDCEISRHFSTTHWLVGLTDVSYCISTSVVIAFSRTFPCHYTKIKFQTCISF